MTLIVFMTGSFAASLGDFGRGGGLPDSLAALYYPIRAVRARGHGKKTMRSLKRFVAAVAVSLFAVLPARAAEQPAAEFYRDHDITLYIGTAPGGAYDLFGRMVARHMSRHVPGEPAIVPVNMEGAGSLKLANQFFTGAPRDGSVIAVINRGTPYEPLIGNSGPAHFDPTKFTWIGSPTGDMSVCVAWHEAGVDRFEQLFEKQIFVGSTGGGASTEVFPKAINGVLGTKLKIVPGYPGGNDIDFAMERGEVDARCGWSWSSVVSTKKEWLDRGLIKVLIQLSLEKNPQLPDVPHIMDFAKTEEQRQMFRLVFSRESLGYPFLAPPGLSAERTAVLRTAFEDTVKDPAFLAEAARARVSITPVKGEHIRQLLAEAYATPKDVVEKTRAALR
jgi:tripartite-type tricarboxylate transporter receptor subunit TctC